MDAVLINVLFYHKGHVTKTKVYQVSENYEIVWLNFYSVTVLSFESAVVHFKIFHLEVISYNFTTLNTVNKIIFFSNIRVSNFILEKHSVIVAVKTFFFDIVFNIPNYDAIFCWTLLDSNAHDTIITPGSDLFYECSNFFFRYINLHFCNHFID